MYDYLGVEDSLPLTKELTGFLRNKDFVLQSIGKSSYSKTHEVNHLKFVLGDERVILTISKRKNAVMQTAV